MKKIMYVPLDERPCNYYYAKIMLEGNKEIELIQPPLNILGYKKTPANYELLSKYIIDNINDCFGLIISIDMLLYGGIVPSRLHNNKQDELLKRLNLIRKIKELKPDIKIYAFSLIMRCPQYNSSDEEPDYYEFCGYDIFKYGEISHKISLNIATNEEKEKLSYHYEKCKGYFEEYVSRRKINSDMNIHTIKLLYDNIIDFLVFPQDDSSLYGLISLDQQKVSKEIKNMGLENQILIYPGADEVGMVLISRMINYINNKKPKLYVQFSSPKGNMFVPMFEDREIYKTIEKQISSSGCQMCEDVNEADGIFMFNTPTLDLKDANITQGQCDVLKGEVRNIDDFVLKIKAYLSEDKKVSIADVAKINRGDEELVNKLCKEGVFFDLSGYAGWNTSSNTLGTALTHLVIAINYGNTLSLKNHLALRVYEDIGYMDYAREYITNNELPKMNLNYFNSGEIKGEVSEMVKQKVIKRIKLIAPQVYEKYEVVECYMPWCRMFEVALKVNKR